MRKRSASIESDLGPRNAQGHDAETSTAAIACNVLRGPALLQQGKVQEYAHAMRFDRP
jgi:hypothetical protein